MPFSGEGPAVPASWTRRGERVAGKPFRSLLKSVLAFHEENREICHHLQRCQARGSGEAGGLRADEPAGFKGRIYLIDTMSFIFRAYHAMARQRPMSTKTGIPTSATFVFVKHAAQAAG